VKFWKALLGLLRRRAVASPVFLLAAVASLVAFLVVPARYTTNAIVMLAPPVNGGITNTNPFDPAGGTNPLLLQTEGLRTAVATLVLTFSVEEVRASVGAPKFGSTDLVVNDGSTEPQLIGMTGPFLYIEADSNSAAKANAVVRRTRERLAAELDWRQRNLRAPTNTYVGITDVVPPSEPETSYTDRIAAAVLAFGLGIFVGLSAAYGFLRTRAVRAARRQAEGDPVAPDEQPEPAKPADEDVPRDVLADPERDAAGTIHPSAVPMEVNEDTTPTQTMPIVVVDDKVPQNGRAPFSPRK
jgi:hypothetical protein